MWSILLALVLGVALGRWLRPGDRLRCALSWVSLASLAFLLICLGASVGANQDLVSSLTTMGGRAVILALAAIAGSVLLAWLLQLTCLRELSLEEDTEP